MFKMGAILLTMLGTLDLVNEIFYIISAVFVALLAVEVMDVVVSLILVLPHGLHGNEALEATFERACDRLHLSTHVSQIPLDCLEVTKKITTKDCWRWKYGEGDEG